MRVKMADGQSLQSESAGVKRTLTHSHSPLRLIWTPYFSCRRDYPCRLHWHGAQLSPLNESC